MIDKQEIIEKAHFGEGSDLARAYWLESGIDFYSITKEDCEKLRDLISKICIKLRADDSYRMIKDYDCRQKIKIDKYGIFITMKGSYFDKREGVSIYAPNKELNDLDFPVGFGGWASGCNRIPLVEGFVKWVDLLKEKNSQTLSSEKEESK